MFGLISLAVALLLFPWPSSWVTWRALASIALAGIYLTKSSMLPAVEIWSIFGDERGPAAV